MEKDLKKIDLVLFAGQSNMAGRGITSEKWPEKAPKVIAGAGYEYRAVSDPFKLFPMEEPFGVDENDPQGICDIFSGGIKAKTGSLVSSFTNAYFRLTGTPVVGVSASKGGSTLSQWQPDAKDNFLNDAINRLESARKWLLQNGYEIKHCFAVWSQGESDGDAETSESDYIRLFRNFWGKLSAHVTDIYMIKTGMCNIPGENTRYDTVRAAQEKIDSTDENVHICARTFGFLLGEGLMKDAFHYYQKGYNLCGETAGRNTAKFILAKDRIKAPFKWEMAVCGDFPDGSIENPGLSDINIKTGKENIEEYCDVSERQSVTHPIAPVYDKNSEILVLGSFPSVKSREQCFFYGHKQNRFWKVLAAVFDENVPETIEEKKAFLLRNRVAVWDVIGSCTIVGSSDASIRDVKPNDLSVILDAADIREIFCNGAKSYEMYEKYLREKTGREAVKLPSTSPANAAMSLDKLTGAWKAVLGEKGKKSKNGR